MVSDAEPPVARDCHLDAALAIWKQSDKSLRWLFPQDIDRDAEKLLKGLKEASEALTKTQIRDRIFRGHFEPKPLGALLNKLCVHRRNTSPYDAIAADRVGVNLRALRQAQLADLEFRRAVQAIHEAYDARIFAMIPPATLAKLKAGRRGKDKHESMT